MSCGLRRGGCSGWVLLLAFPFLWLNFDKDFSLKETIR